MKLCRTIVNGAILWGYEGDSIYSSIMHKHQFFEQSTLVRWQRYYQNAKVIADVGANLGNHSVYWAQNTSATIHAFEPYPANFQLLVKNVEENCADCIICRQSAVGADCTKAVLATDVSESELGNASYTYGDGETEMVSLDKYFVDRKESVDFVKIDVEGFELEVLKGMTGILAVDAPALWIETEPDHVPELLNILNRYDYRMIDIQGMNVLFQSTRREMETGEIEQEEILSRMLAMHSSVVYLENENHRLRAEIHRLQNT